MPAPGDLAPPPHSLAARHAAPPCALVAAVEPAELQRFGEMMRAEGFALNVARMGLDRLYAQERIALAYTSADERLRLAALRLFDAYQAGQPLPRQRRAHARFACRF